MKKDAWNKIQNEFNCQSIENPRTADVLKNKYDNIKRKVKKQYADEKIYHRSTGGGPSKTFLQSSVAITIGELLQNKMTGEIPIYDSDAPNACNVQIDKNLIEPDIDIVMYENVDDNIIAIEEEIITMDNISELKETHNIEEQHTSN